RAACLWTSSGSARERSASLSLSRNAWRSSRAASAASIARRSSMSTIDPTHPEIESNRLPLIESRMQRLDRFVAIAGVKSVEPAIAKRFRRLLPCEAAPALVEICPTAAWVGRQADDPKLVCGALYPQYPQSDVLRRFFREPF